MPFYIDDPAWRGRSRDGIPGQSLTHRPTMEGSDCSSSDDDDVSIYERPRRLSKTTHTNPYTAVQEYQRCQIEEIIVAIKEFDTFAARYPPESIPKPRSYYTEEAVSVASGIYPEIDPTDFAYQGYTDHELTTSHVRGVRDPAYTSVTPRSESPSTNSFISDFAPQWPSFAQEITTVSSYDRLPVASEEKPPVEEPKRTSSPFSATRKFFTRLWAKRVTRSNIEPSAANRNRNSESARSEAILSPSRGADFTDSSLR